MASQKNEDEIYNDALSNYYKLKNEYEKKYNAKKTKILNNDLLSLKDKKREINNLKKKCINCGKDGGTLFNFKDGNLIALCGNYSKPCNLNISIKKSKVLNMKELLPNLENEIEEIKVNIIKVKLDFLFNFNNQEISLQLFEKYKKDLENINMNYNDLFLKYLSIVNNDEKNTKINDNLLIQNNLINKLKLLNKEYSKSNSVFLINEIVEIYINELSKLNEVLLNLKYDFNKIEKIETSMKQEQIFKLFQEKNKIKDFEILIEKSDIKSFKK